MFRPVLLCICVFLATLSQATASDLPDSPSAWDVLLKKAPALARDLSAEERQLLQALTPEQAEAFAEGTDPAEIPLSGGRSLADLLESKGLNSFEVSWWSVDGGSGRSTGGSFTLTATVGQPEAGRLAGGSFILVGGFVTPSAPGLIFSDGFESGGTSAWSSASAGR